MTSIMAGYEGYKVVFRRFEHTGSDESLSAPGSVAHHGYIHEVVTPEEGDVLWNRPSHPWSDSLVEHSLRIGEYGRLEGRN